MTLARLALLVLLVAWPSLAWSQEEPLTPALQESLRDDNPVAATVNGWPIHWNDVVRSAAALPPEYHDKLPLLFSALLSRMIDLRLLAEEARAQGYAERPDIQRQVALYEDRLLGEALMADLIGANINEAAIEERVAALTSSGPRPELKARIIVTGAESTAREALRAINSGQDFASVAVKFSVHSTAANGGDLGWVAQGEVELAALGELLFGMAPGEYTYVPVKLEIGWVLAKVEEKRVSEPPPATELEQRIRREMVRLALDRLLADLREAAKIDFFPE